MVKGNGRPITDYFARPAQPRPNKRRFASDETANQAQAPALEGKLTHDLDSIATHEHVPRKTPRCRDSRSMKIFPQPLQTQEPSSSLSPPPPNMDPERQMLASQKNLGSSFSDASATASQAPTLSSSQRVVKNGEVMIRNSDGESDSDTSSLADIDTILNIHTKEESSTPPEAALPFLAIESSVGNTMENETRRNRKSRRSSPKKSAIPGRSSDRMSLAMLAKQRKQYETSREEITTASALLEIHKQHEAQAHHEVLDQSGSQHASLIDTVMQHCGDEEEVDRLKIAIRRTEALNYNRTWSFFDKDDGGQGLGLPEFPTVNSDQLATMFSDTSSQQQSFASGFVGEYAFKETLPDEILLWIMDATCLEPRSDLREPYSISMQQVPPSTTPLMTPDRIKTLFEKVGASDEALDTKRPVTPRVVISEKVQNPRRPKLLSLLDYLHGAALSLDTTSRQYFVCLLCRLLLDHTIAHDRRILRAVESVFATLLELATDEDYQGELQAILSDVYNFVDEMPLRLQLIQSIPGFPQRSNILRRRLALAYFFNDATYFTKELDSLVDFKAIVARLQTPQFNINKATDYSGLAATSAILSIGLDSGDRPARLSKSAEATFNEHVDMVDSKIRAMFTQIIDSGASNMKRTEAKEVLEGIHCRLLYAVRTKPPPKKMIFGVSEVNYAGEKKALRAFLESGKVEDASNGAEGKQDE